MGIYVVNVTKSMFMYPDCLIYWGFVIYAYQEDTVFGRKMGLVHLQKNWDLT